MKNYRKTALILIAIILLATSFANAAQQAADTGIKILPATKAIAVPAPPAPADDKAAPAKPSISYEQAYNSIPFSRAEYLANPSYRHDAAVEMVFGQLRETTIVRNSQPFASDYSYGYDNNNYGYITPYRYYRNGLGRSYNFYYPMPSVYRNY